MFAADSKILQILGSLQEGQRNLQEGQKRLEEGQKNLELRQSSLEHGQKNLELRQSSLEQGQKSLEEGQKTLQIGQKGLAEGQKRLEVTVEKHGQQIDMLIDTVGHINTTLKSVATKHDLETGMRELEVKFDAKIDEVKSAVIMLEAKVVKRIQRCERRITNIEEQVGIEDPDKN